MDVFGLGQFRTFRICRERDLISATVFESWARLDYADMFSGFSGFRKGKATNSAELPCRPQFCLNHTSQVSGTALITELC